MFCDGQALRTRFYSVLKSTSAERCVHYRADIVKQRSNIIVRITVARKYNQVRGFEESSPISMTRKDVSRVLAWDHPSSVE